MKFKLSLSLLLIVALLWGSTPAHQNTQKPSPSNSPLPTTAEAFADELTQYAAMYGDAALVEYVQARLSQMTLDAVNQPSLARAERNVPPNCIILWEGPTQINTICLDEDREGGGCNLYFCLYTRQDECRRNYNADLFESFAAASAIAAGCIALAGPALAVCLAAALAAHAAGVAAASQRFHGCNQRALSDCQIQCGRR